MTNAEEILAMLAEQGKINLEDAAAEAEMKKKERIVLAQHKTAVSEWSDGRWHTYIEKKGKRKHIAKNSYQELIDFLYHEYEHERKMTLESLYPEWLEYKKLQAVRDTYPIRIATDWKKFYKGDPITRVPLTDLTPIKCETWLLKLIKKHQMTRTAYYNAAVIIRQCLDYAVRTERIEENPCKKVHIDAKLFRRTQKKADEEQVFTDEEVAAFEQLAWEDFRNAGRKVYRLAPLAALFSLYTGTRVGETTGFQLSDIDGNDIIVNRFVEKDRHTVVDHAKTAAGTGRRIPLISKAREIVNACRSFKLENGSVSPWLFSEHSNPLPSRIVEEYYRRYCNEIGTVPKTPHCSRKTYISCLIDNGVNINTVRKYVGHADERTTLRNYVFDRSTPAEKMRQLEEALAYNGCGQPVGKKSMS